MKRRIKLNLNVTNLEETFLKLKFLIDIKKPINQYRNCDDWFFILALRKFNPYFYGKIYTDWEATPLRIYDEFGNDIFVFNFYKGQYREYVISKYSKQIRKTDEKWACKIIIKRLSQFGYEKIKLFHERSTC